MNKGGGYMKKNICIIIIVCVLATLSVSFADHAVALGNDKEQFNQIRQQVDSRIKEYRDRIIEVKSLYNDIRQKNDELLRLKKEVIDSQKKAKIHIQELIKDKDSITDKQFIKLKDAVVTLNDARKALKVTIGEISRVTLQLRAAKRNKNFNLLRQHGGRIIIEQNLRIERLEKLINDLNKISKI